MYSLYAVHTQLFTFLPGPTILILPSSSHSTSPTITAIKHQETNQPGCIPLSPKVCSGFRSLSCIFYSCTTSYPSSLYHYSSSQLTFYLDRPCPVKKENSAGEIYMYMQAERQVKEAVNGHVALVVGDHKWNYMDEKITMTWWSWSSSSSFSSWRTGGWPNE